MQSQSRSRGNLDEISLRSRAEARVLVVGADLLLLSPSMPFPDTIPELRSSWSAVEGLGLEARLHRSHFPATPPSLLPSPLPLHTALAAPPRTSLTDRSGNYVVDIQKAAAGLEDPLAEPEGAFSTISAALAVAPAGSTVLVRAGTYTERVFVTRPGIQLLAEPGAVVAWRSDKPYEAALTVDLSEAASGGSVTISGLTVRHSSPSIAQNYAVYVPPPSRAASATKVELRDLDVSSSSGDGA